MKTARLVAMALALFLSSANVRAQFHDPNDLGVTDTLDMVFSVTPRAATNQKKVQIDLWVLNDSNDVGSAAAGFKWINDNLKMDSARFTPLTQANFDLARFVYEGSNINTTNTNHRFPFVGARSFEPGVLADPSRRLWCRYYFTLTSWSVNDSIVLDTNAYNTGVTYKFVDTQQKSYRAYWTGKKVIHDPDYVPPSTMAVSVDTLFFSSVFGQPSPPSQTFNITSTPNPVPFTVTENASWLLKSPAVGNTPAVINVSTNVTALPIGNYFDSLIVESTNATNSPKIVYVKLAIIAPPPQIKVTPSALFFSAVVGGSNPASKNLIIKNNAPGSVLNWTLVHAQSWLTLSPMSGVDSNTVVASVDITGLTFGTYYDTIVVTDPAASNNPQKVPVSLQMGSNLPILQADSGHYFFVVSLDELILFSRSINITNGGIGSLDFKLTEDANRIFYVTPDTGSAPQQVTVQYKISTAFNGQEVTDTIWATSAQAVNSPYPIVITLRFVDVPANIGLTTDTVKLTTYECQQGGGNVLPQKTFTVQNAGGDDPMAVRLVHSSDFFSLNTDSGYAPINFRVTAKFPDTALGTYYDTILVTAKNAINNPRIVIVKYDRLAGTEPPVMVVNKTSWAFPYREDSGPSQFLGLSITNSKPGCMPWNIVEDVPWLFPTKDTGNVPADVGAIADAPGYSLGIYKDTVQIFGQGAVNSPWIIPVELRVWKLRCDVDWDGHVDISDVVGLIAYSYFDGPSPQPTFLVGDCDCDDLVDIADITRLIDYAYFGGPVICTNPY